MGQRVNIIRQTAHIISVNLTYKNSSVIPIDATGSVQSPRFFCCEQSLLIFCISAIYDAWDREGLLQEEKDEVSL